MTYERFCRTAFWACVLAILYLSLTPGQLRPHTGAPGPIEHVAAYVVTGFLLAPGLTARMRIVAALGLSALSGGLEIIQLFVPGRSGNFAGFYSSSTGAFLGMGAGALFEVLRRGPVRSGKPGS